MTRPDRSRRGAAQAARESLDDYPAIVAMHEEQVERAEAEVARLRETLRPFAEHGPYGTWKGADYVDACKAAQQALASDEGETA